jgi:hypothetical protein
MANEMAPAEGSAIAASSSPSAASHRPEKPASSVPLTSGPDTSSRAVNDESAGSMLTSALSKPSHRRASGYQALYTASLQQNSSRSQFTTSPCARAGLAVSSASRARSSPSETSRRIPSGSGSLGSASMPMAAMVDARATAAARYPAQCVMLPTTPSGHRGARPSPGSSGAAGMPSSASAWRAHRRTVLNSRCRASIALAMTACSAGKRSASGTSSKASADATQGVRISSIMTIPALASSRSY